jgi:hypothetical protein
VHVTDALPLPPRPDAAQYRKLAKELLAAVRSDDPEAIPHFARGWLTRLRHRTGEPERPDAGREGERFAEQLDAYWKGERVPKEMPPPRRTLAGAQLVIARVHGFTTWGALVRHVEALRSPESAVARFEASVDAIVSGDMPALERLLAEHPELAHERSTRSHGATLLHYVSANGVEGYRQRTPPNVVQVAKLLLRAGADVNATAECYGGGDTPLGLTSTSVHPAEAGVMTDLLATLTEAGADPQSRDGGWGKVRAALANGQPEAARWLAEHGATLDLEEAAGLGRLDVVRRFVADDGTLRTGATEGQRREAFRWAAGYGHPDVVTFLLEHGSDAADAAEDGATALHHAAYHGHADLVELLLARGAAVDPRERTYDGTPLEWAVYGWATRGTREGAESDHHAVVARLVRAGARLTPEWAATPRIAERLGEDPRMRAALEEREAPPP